MVFSEIYYNVWLALQEYSGKAHNDSWDGN